MKRVDRRREPARPPRSWSGSFPLRLWSRNEWDSHTHWPCRRKAKQEKYTAGVELLRILYLAKPRMPLRVTMTYIFPKRLDPDNVVGAFKYVQDAIAAAVGVDDGNERYEWIYKQERGKPKQYAVRIEIEERI